MIYRYFTDNEFMRAVPSCKLDKMDEEFMTRLDNARHIAGYKFVILSAYRNVAWEKAMGRNGTSSHTKGVAVDIKCVNSEARLFIVRALLEVGFKRIGIYDSFIHVDSDSSKGECIYLG